MQVPGLDIRVDSEDVPWRETQTAGVRWLHLGPADAAGEGSAREATVLIRMEPGCGYPPHRHLGVEEVLVLSGGYRDELGTHTAGSYLRYESGSMHGPLALGDSARPAGDSNPACVLFAVVRGGIEILEPGAHHSGGSRR